jgi:uncharacterized membrane-anchored protein YhcB (DUF1043 family)
MENMNDNPYESPSDGTSTRWIRPWRVALVVGLFLALVVGPLIWQRYREQRARNSVRQNLEQIGRALEQYQQRNSQSLPGDPQGVN